MHIKVTADSTCDLSPKQIEDYHITLFPIYVRIGDEMYQDGVSIHPQEIFSRVEQGDPLPATAAMNVEDYRNVFAELAGAYDAVIHIALSSTLSSSYQNACLAAEEFSNVYVIDSLTGSCGQGLLVMEAIRLSRQGLSGSQIAQILKDTAPRIETSFLVDRLDYLQKGGRCSMLAMLGANLLHIKPCIEIIDGILKVAEKYRGPFAKCMGEYCRKRLENRNDIQDGMVFIVSSMDNPAALAAAKNAVTAYGNFANVYEVRAGCSISSHVGPNAMGILFIRK